MNTKKNKNKQKVLKRARNRLKKENIFKNLKRSYRYHKITGIYFKIFRYFKAVPRFNLKLAVNIFPNNIFLNLSQVKKYKTLKKASSGMFSVKITKKRLYQGVGIILQKFLKKIKFFLHRRNLLIVLTSPRFLKRKVIKLFRNSLLKRNLFFKVLASKCFNGCRPKKKRRKKRIRVKIFKVV